MQIWGSDAGATQMMIRGMADKGGTFGINHSNRGTPGFRNDLYGKEVKINVIHLQEDVGNRILVYLDDQVVLNFPDNERVTNHDGNYHKYGCYGTVRAGHESPLVKWRKVRHYMNGRAPGDLTGIYLLAHPNRRGGWGREGQSFIFRSGMPVFDARGRTVSGIRPASGSVLVLGPVAKDGPGIVPSAGEKP